MFSKSSKDAAKPEPQTDGPASPAKPSPPTLISKDLRIVGDLRSDGEIQVDGAIEGDIRSKTLLVGETAHLKGEITADSVVIHGTVNGQIKARSVKLARTAHMVGDILHEDLAIETGAFLEGHCKRIQEKPASTKPVSAAKADKTDNVAPAPVKASA